MKYTIIDRIVERPVTVAMISLLIIGFGLFALGRMKVTLYPNIDIPVVAISTGYRNVSPDDIARLLVEPIEAAVGSIPGVETVEGNARKGSAFITLRLAPGTDARAVESEAREQLDRIRNDLPREATPPVIFQFDPENAPIMRFAIRASNRGLDELRTLSVELAEPLIERVPGVASADTRGGLQRTIHVELDPFRLAQHRLTTAEIEGAIRRNNQQVPVGSLTVERLSYNVRATSVFTEVAEIGETIIKLDAAGTPIRVRDVADVVDGFVDVTSMEEIDGQNSVTIEIQKRSDANTLETAQGVLAAIPDILERMPPGVSISVLSNDGDNIERSISNLAQSAMLALVLVVIILLVFLGGWRSSTVVALSIPISMTATFASMYFLGLTLNFVSITGLALAVGLLVDSSIVVLESVVAKLEQGMGKARAVIEGTKEVIGALWGSTLTTLVVFIPFLFVSGPASVFTNDLAITISLAISYAFLASFILVPVFAKLLLKTGQVNKDKGIQRIFHNLEIRYARGLGWCLTHKKWVLAGVVLVFFGTRYVSGQLENVFMPSSDAGQINLNVELPQGSTLVQTAQVVRGIAAGFKDDPLVETVVSSIGQGGWRAETNYGRITLNLVPADQRPKTSDQIATELRRKYDIPGVRINIWASGGSGFRFGGRGGGGGIGQEVRVTLTGADTEILKGISDRIETVMLQDTSVISVDNPRVDAAPEIWYIMDRQLAGRMGTNLGEVANSFKTQARSTQVGFYRTGGREIPIEVRMKEEYRRSLADISRFEVVQTAEGPRVPLAQLGRFETVEGVNRIQRRDRETILDVRISVNGDATAVRERIVSLLEREVVMPEGYRYAFTGTNQDQQQANASLLYALLAGLLLTYMVMAAKFENYRDPFVIMFSIPLAFFGSYLMLWITGTPTSMPAYLGMIILVGIVINNGIVLVERVHQTAGHSEGADYIRTLISASKERLRPVILTALTTIGSMIPLAMELSSGSETWSPLAKAVIGGLAFSSVFTLFVVPVFLVGLSKTRRAAAAEYAVTSREIPTP